jgi:LPXTG-motif cell wall-anchored protein
MTAALLSVVMLAAGADLDIDRAANVLDSDDPASRLTVVLPQSSGAHGQEVEVPVTVAGARELGCLQMALIYDEKLLEVTAVQQGPLLPEGAIVEHDKTIPGRLGLGFISGPNAEKNDLVRVQGDGVIFTIRFKVLGHAGQKSPLTPKRASAWEVSNAALPLRGQAGEFTITGERFPWLYVLLGLLGLVLLAFVLRRGRKAA